MLHMPHEHDLHGGTPDRDLLLRAQTPPTPCRSTPPKALHPFRGHRKQPARGIRSFSSEFLSSRFSRGMQESSTSSPADKPHARPSQRGVVAPAFGKEPD